MQILPLEMSIHGVETGLKAPQENPCGVATFDNRKNVCVAHSGVSILEAQHSSTLPSRFQKKKKD